MTASTLEPWTQEHRDVFRRAPMVGPHTLQSAPGTAELFSFDALAELIDRTPEPYIDVLTMGRGRHEPKSWRGGRRNDLNGKQLLDAVANGRLWINLRHAMNIDAAYSPIQDRMFADLKAENPGFRPMNPLGSILISSPHAQVFYHADPGEVLLWHLHGEKQFWVYPNTAPFLPDEEYEGVILSEQNEELPYDESFDEYAQVFDLKPGQVASWPHGAPHRIVNGDSVNVSITTEFTTLQSRVRYGAYLANGVMRRRFGARPTFAGMSGAEQAFKFALSLPLRALKAKNSYAQQHYDYFDVDMNAPDCVRTLDTPIPVEERTQAERQAA